MDRCASRSVLIIDDDEDITSLLEALVETREEYVVCGRVDDLASGHDVVSAMTPPPHAIVIGAHRGTFDAMEAIASLRRNAPDSSIILLADLADPITLLDALSCGATTVLSSGWGWSELMPALDLLFEGSASAG